MGQKHYSASMFLGETSRGMPQPVFFDTHTPLFNNRPPGILITGEPGSGKTFASLNITTFSALAGKTVIVLDYKGDFLCLKNLEKELGKVNVWDLSGGGRSGLLDPFFLGSTPSERFDLTLAVIELFLGGLEKNEITALSPVIKDVIATGSPSLGKVLQTLRQHKKEIARNIATRLDNISTSPAAKLAFAPASVKDLEQISFGKGITVVSMLGFDLPANPEEANRTNQGRLANGILYLLISFIRKVLKDDESFNPKLLMIDEAWSVLSTQAGADIVREVALLGRSKNLALLMASQNLSHFQKLDITNTITTRFAFKSSRNDAALIVNDMELDKNQGFEDLLVDLSPGECLMQDWTLQYSTVQISDWRKDWAEAFNTNPLDKIRKAQEKAKEKEEAQNNANKKR